MVFVVRWLAYHSNDDGPGKAMAADFLSLPFLLGTAVFGLWSGVLGLLPSSSHRLRPWFFLPMGVVAGFFLLMAYGPPTTTLFVDYEGKFPSMVVDIETHDGEKGTELKPGVPEKVSTGQGMRHVHVEWRRTYNDSRQRQDFNLEREIPVMGANRVIKVHVFDTNATYEVLRK